MDACVIMARSETANLGSATSCINKIPSAAKTGKDKLSAYFYLIQDARIPMILHVALICQRDVDCPHRHKDHNQE